MTFGDAAFCYFDEIGADHKHAGTTQKALQWLDREIGHKLLTDIDDTIVRQLVSKRSKELVPNKKKPTRVGPATINRTMTEVLRKVLNHVRKTRDAKIGRITWKDHFLPEPQERVREASYEEEAGVMDHLARGYDDAIEFAFSSGCRRMEILSLVWDQVHFHNREFVVIGKRDQKRTIPMTQDLFDLLVKQQGHHPEYVFTYEAARTRKVRVGDQYEKRIRGVRYPMTDAGLKTAMQRAVKGAGVKNFRFHDTRHTMATRTLRDSKNIRIVQKLLGHGRVTTTERYAHVTNDDIRAAMESVERAKNPTKSPTVNDGTCNNSLPELMKSA